MYQKDQIRIWAALIILLIIGITYWITADKELSGKIALGGLMAWLLLMYFLRKKD